MVEISASAAKLNAVAAGQVPLTTFVGTTNKKSPVAFRDFRFVTVKSRKFSGYRRQTVGDLPVVVADEAKAIVDSLDLPNYAGGLGEIARALQAGLGMVEVETLVQYANRVGDKSLGSRLGYLLETLGQPVEGLIRSASLVKLDVSASRSGKTDPRWQVIVNVPERSLVPQGVG